MKANFKLIKLKDNQYSVEVDGAVYFQSYTTVVCKITNYDNGNEPLIEIAYGQPESKTTATYLNKFLQMHTAFDNYKQIK